MKSHPSIKVETPIIELPSDDNKLLMKTMMHPPSQISLYPSEDEEEEVKPNNVWQYAIDVLLKLSPLHPGAKGLKKWFKYQDMEPMEHLFQWNENDTTIGKPIHPT